MNTLQTVGAIGVLLGACNWASAAPILSISSQGATAAASAEQDFLDAAHSGYLTETFDDNSYYTVGSQAGTITSSVGVGSFTSAVPGSGGLCDSGPYNCNGGLAVLNAGASPFSGRYSVSGDNWLDRLAGSISASTTYLGPLWATAEFSMSASMTQRVWEMSVFFPTIPMMGTASTT